MVAGRGPARSRGGAARGRRRGRRRRRRRRLHGALDRAELRRRDPSLRVDRARGRARRLRAERPERRLPETGYWCLAAAAPLAARRRGRAASSRARRRARSRPSEALGEDVWLAARRDAEGLDHARPGRRHRRAVRVAAELGVPDRRRAFAVEPAASSPVFRRGVRFPDAATVQPARLVRALRRAALGAGVELHERTRVDSIRPRRGRDTERPGARTARSSSPRTPG